MIIDSPKNEYIPQLRHLWTEAFGDTEEYLDTFFSTAFSPDRCLCAASNGEVAGAVYYFSCACRGKKVAYVYALATAQSHRGQGIAHRLMEELHRRLEALDYEGTVLVPGEDSLFSLYSSMGYQTCTTVTEFVSAGAADEVQLRRISAGEYAQQRAELLSYLEEGAVLQEGENLSFLATQANFYAGHNFLLAARPQGTMLVGLELLGDAQWAPGIVQTLGYTMGSFRTRGAGKPFAMYRPLPGSTMAMPTYFGLAFD